MKESAPKKDKKNQSPKPPRILPPEGMGEREKSEEEASPVVEAAKKEVSTTKTAKTEKPKITGRKKEVAQGPEPVFKKKTPVAEKAFAPAPKKAENEKKEAEAEKHSQPLEKARESYVRAKLKLEKLVKSQSTAEFLSDEEIAEKENARKELGKTEKEYAALKTRDLEQYLENGDFKKENLKKITAFYLVKESKKAYDLKTNFLIEERAKEKPWIVGKLNQLHDWYKNRSWKEKLAIGVGLSGLGFAAGIGGATGAAIGALVVGARGTLSGLGAFTITETIMKKRQEKDKESRFKNEYKNYRNLVQESLKETEANTAKGLVKFLQSRDLGLKLERAAGKTEEELRNYEKNLQNRRYLMAGVVGILAGLGASYLTFENIAAKGGFDVRSVIEKAEAKAPLVPPGATPESITHVAGQHANLTATVEKGGSISKSAWQLVNEGKLSKEEMLKAWKNSFIEIHGVKVPIKDAALSHAGDQVTYIPGAHNSAGHFEVVDYAKDKLSLGTTQDLQEIYEKLDKEPPEWLEVAAKKDLNDVFSDNMLDAQEIRVIEHSFQSGSLARQENILERILDKMGLPHGEGKEFSKLFVKLSSSEARARAGAIYEANLKSIGLNPKEYAVVKDMTVGEFLKNRGRSWFLDYFFHPDSAPLASAAKDATPVSEILHQRKLAEFLRKSLPSVWEKNLTIEKFLKSFML